MIVEGQDYVKGNTVLKPQRQVRKPNKKNDNNNKDKNSLIRKRELKEKKKKRNAILQISLLVFILGVVTIWRDTKVYKLQNELGKIKTGINNIKAENEALKVDLLKNASLTSIEKNAKDKLNMINSADAEKINLDLSKNYLEGLNN